MIQQVLLWVGIIFLTGLLAFWLYFIVIPNLRTYFTVWRVALKLRYFLNKLPKDNPMRKESLADLNKAIKSLWKINPFKDE